MNINPFVLSPAIPDELFCDRQKESASLMKSIINQENVVLISPRRVGKTGLIYHCFNQSDIHDNYVTVSIDILHTTSFQEFLKELGTAVFNTIAKRSEYLTKLFVTTLRSLSGSFGLDPVTFMPTFDIKLGQITMPEYTLDEIFTYLEKADKPCIVAIDEFQQITKYQERNIEALLRGRIQKLVNTHFIFAGSEQRLMNEMFFSDKRNAIAADRYVSRDTAGSGYFVITKYPDTVVTWSRWGQRNHHAHYNTLKPRIPARLNVSN